MKPFDLEKAIAGEPLVTRDGSKAEFIAYVPEAVPLQRIICIVNGCVITASIEGRIFSGTHENEKDLFMALKKRTVWVNFYEYGDCHYFKDEGEANYYSGYHAADGQRLGGKAYPVEIEE